MSDNNLTILYSHYHNQIHLMLKDPILYQPEIKSVYSQMMAFKQTPTDNLLETLIHCASRWPDGLDLAKRWFTTITSRQNATISTATYNNMLSFYSGGKIKRPPVDKRSLRGALEITVPTPDETTFVHILAIHGLLGDISGINATMTRVEEAYPLLLEKCASQWSIDPSATRERLDRVFSIARMTALVSCVEKDAGLYTSIFDKVYLPMTDPSPPIFYAMIKAAFSAGRHEDIPILWGRVLTCWDRPSKELCLRFLIAHGRAGMCKAVGELNKIGEELHGKGWERGGLVKAYSYCDYESARIAFEECGNGGKGAVHAMIDACFLGGGREREVAELRKFL
jgi:hypothetical protein